MSKKEVTEFLYTSSQIVCVKDDKGGSEITLVLACLQENAIVSMKKKKSMAKFLLEIRRS